MPRRSAVPNVETAKWPFLRWPAADGNLRQFPEPLRLVPGHAARGQGRPGHAALRRPVGDVRPVPERPARHDDHADPRPVRRAHLSRRSPGRQRPGHPRQGVTQRPRSLFRELDGMRTARGLWGGVSAEAASSPVNVSWKKWEKDNAMVPMPPRWPGPTTTILPGRWWIHPPQLTTIRGDSWYRGTFNVTPDQVDCNDENAPIRSAPGKPQGEARRESTQGHRLSQRPVAAGPHGGRLQAPRCPARTRSSSTFTAGSGGDSGQLGIERFGTTRRSRTPPGISIAASMISTKPPSSGASRTGTISLRIVRGKPALPRWPNQPTFWRCRFDWHKTPNALQTVGLDTDRAEGWPRLAQRPQPWRIAAIAAADVSDVHARMLDQGRLQRPRRPRHLRQQARPVEAFALRSICGQPSVGCTLIRVD